MQSGWNNVNHAHCPYYVLHECQLQISISMRKTHQGIRLYCFSECVLSDFVANGCGAARALNLPRNKQTQALLSADWKQHIEVCRKHALGLRMFLWSERAPKNIQRPACKMRTSKFTWRCHPMTQQSGVRPTDIFYWFLKKYNCPKSCCAEDCNTSTWPQGENSACNASRTIVKLNPITMHVTTTRNSLWAPYCGAPIRRAPNRTPSGTQRFGLGVLGW